jgi:flagellar biosynthesis protein FliR
MTVSVAQFQLFLLAFTRIMAILVQVPVLGGRLIPNEIKIGLGLLLTLILAPVAMPHLFPLSPDTPAMSLFVLGAAIARELAVGLVAGFAASLTFGVLQMAAEFMSGGSGFAAGRAFNPAFEGSGSSYDQLFLITTSLFFLAINGHHLVLMAVQQTFKALPLNSDFAQLGFLSSGDALKDAERVMSLTVQLIGAGTLLALPVMGTALLTDLTLGLLARVAPQVQVFFLGMPLKVGLSLLVLAVALEVLSPAIRDLLRAIGPRMLFLLGA